MRVCKPIHHLLLRVEEGAASFSSSLLPYKEIQMLNRASKGCRITALPSFLVCLIFMNLVIDYVLAEWFMALSLWATMISIILDMIIDEELEICS